MVENCKRTMKIAILGAGQLGSELFENLKERFDVQLFSHDSFNVCCLEQIHKIVKKFDLIINCTANINADAIETLQRESSFNVNYLAVKNLAELCKKYSKMLVHISSDYVYGSNSKDEILNEEFQCHPVNQYGIDKLAGENAVVAQNLDDYLILRVSWLFGKNGKQNFIEKIKANLKNLEMKVVDDQIGNITSTKTVIKVIEKYINGLVPAGLYNVQNNDEVVSRYEIACFIKECLGNTSCKIIPCKTSDYQLPAQRQLNSNLCTDKIRKYVDLPKWRDEIRDYLFS